MTKCRAYIRAWLIANVCPLLIPASTATRSIRPWTGADSTARAPAKSKPARPSAGVASPAAQPALLPSPGKLPLAGLTLPKPPPVAVAWSAANVALFTTATLAAQLLLRVGDKLHNSPGPPAAQLPRVDPVSWLSAAFVTHLPQRKRLAHPLWRSARVCVELRYVGHTFFYQPVERCLLWEMEPGLYVVVTDAEQVPLIAELDPYQAPQLNYGYQPDPFQLPPAPRPGSMLKDLG